MLIFLFMSVPESEWWSASGGAGRKSSNLEFHAGKLFGVAVSVDVGAIE